MARRRTWEQLRAELPVPPNQTSGYRRAQRAYELSRQLRTLREAAGLTQAELARLAETAQSAIARLESGTTVPSPMLRTLERVGEVLGADLRVEYLPVKKADPPFDPSRKASLARSAALSSEERSAATRGRDRG